MEHSVSRACFSRWLVFVESHTALAQVYFPVFQLLGKYSKSLSPSLNFVPRNPGSSLFFFWGNNTRILLLFSQSDKEIQGLLWLLWGKQSRMNTSRDSHNACPAASSKQDQAMPWENPTKLKQQNKQAPSKYQPDFRDEQFCLKSLKVFMLSLNPSKCHSHSKTQAVTTGHKKKISWHHL